MSDLDTTIKYLTWALKTAEDLKAYDNVSTSARIQIRTLITYIHSAEEAAKRLFD